MATHQYETTWELDTIFKGGSHSEELQNHLSRLSSELEKFHISVSNWTAPIDANDHSLQKLLDLYTRLSQELREAGAFVSCLQAQDTSDTQANALRGVITTLSSKLNTIMTNFDEVLTKISAPVWDQLLGSDTLKKLTFYLNERRHLAAEKLPKEQEALIHALAIDGYHGWSEMYDRIVSKVNIPFEENGEKTELSVGQAENKFAHQDRQVRRQVFKEWEKSWGKQAELLGGTLNHLAGFRLSMYKQRGWEDVLKEPLEYNRMNKETLDVMWDVISENKQPFIDYLKHKAELFGIEKLSWYDLEAPVGEMDKVYSYTEGADFIINQFAKFSRELANFTKNAFDARWIEAEDRPGKRPGGFCTSFPLSNESRIFMTYSGTPTNVSTLAHELGHAFHSYAMQDVHPLNRNYAMNVAETASTFAEMIVADASVNSAESKEEKLVLLEDKIQRSVAFFMNIHARFLFETRFYEERKKGIVSVERLNELMEQAQKEAYVDSLEEYHPLFWGSKLHFYITGVPFYNFPYTFGYLFSLGIYAQAKKEGAGYAEKYIALLKDTASMTVEELAKKHLHADLTERQFWQDGMEECIKDVREFMDLIKKGEDNN